jgi:hypothetical protein
MTRFTKALVLAGAAAMVISPMAAGAANQTTPVLAQGAAEGAAGSGMTGLAIGGLLAGLLVVGLLVAGPSKSN